MRGALLVRQVVDPDLGIIPADAGSTINGQNGAIYAEDHPRGCGEHY